MRTSQFVFAISDPLVRRGFYPSYTDEASFVSTGNGRPGRSPTVRGQRSEVRSDAPGVTFYWPL